MNEIVPLNAALYSAIEMSRCGIGTLNRVEATTYSEFGVMNGDAWLPADCGISMISSVSKVSSEIRAMRGVLFALMNSHRPSGTPFCLESCGWCASSHG